MPRQPRADLVIPPVMQLAGELPGQPAGGLTPYPVHPLASLLQAIAHGLMGQQELRMRVADYLTQYLTGLLRTNPMAAVMMAETNPMYRALWQRVMGAPFPLDQLKRIAQIQEEWLAGLARALQTGRSAETPAETPAASAPSATPSPPPSPVMPTFTLPEEEFRFLPPFDIPVGASPEVSPFQPVLRAEERLGESLGFGFPPADWASILLRQQLAMMPDINLIPALTGGEFSLPLIALPLLLRRTI